MTVDLRPDCDRATTLRGDLYAIPCGAKADVHIVGRDDERMRVFDRCSRHAHEARKAILRYPGGAIIREEPA
jgi:hypothetical protein